VSNRQRSSSLGRKTGDKGNSGIGEVDAVLGDQRAKAKRETFIQANSVKQDKLARGKTSCRSLEAPLKRFQLPGCSWFWGTRGTGIVKKGSW